MYRARKGSNSHILFYFYSIQFYSILLALADGTDGLSLLNFDWYLQMFRENLSVPSSRVKGSKNSSDCLALADGTDGLSRTSQTTNRS